MDLSCVSRFYEPQGTHFYQESGPSQERLEESKKRIPMICNSFGWSGTCICKDSRTLLAEGLVLVQGGSDGAGHKQWRGERLACVFSDMIVLGTVVTPSILHRNMITLYFCDIHLSDSEGGGLRILHGTHYYVLDF